MRLSRTAWINAGLAVVLVGVGAGGYLALGRSSASAKTTTRTVAVTKGAVTATVTASGNVASATSSEVDFDTSGTISKVYVKVGQKVKKGQKLATLSTTSLKASYLSAKAALEEAQGTYDDTVAGATAAQLQAAKVAVTKAKNDLAVAKADYKNKLKHYKNGTTIGTGANATTVTKADVATAKVAVAQAQSALATAQEAYTTTAAGATTASLNKAKAAIASAKLTLTEAKEALKSAVLKAPQSGTVLSVSASSGDSTSGSGTTTTRTVNGTTTTTSSSSDSTSSTSSSSSSGIIEIADLTTMTVSASVAESDAASIKKGLDVDVTFSATEKEAEGIVTYIGLQGTTSSNVVTFPVVVKITELPSGVKIGATVSLSIATGDVEDVIRVPSSAITTSNSTSTVEVVKNGVTTSKTVKIGLEGDSYTEVTSGLSVGDTVVLSSTSSSSSSSSSGSSLMGGGGGPGMGG